MLVSLQPVFERLLGVGPKLDDRHAFLRLMRRHFEQSARTLDQLMDRLNERALRRLGPPYISDVLLGLWDVLSREVSEAAECSVKPRSAWRRS